MQLRITWLGDEAEQDELCREERLEMVEDSGVEGEAGADGDGRR